MRCCHCEGIETQFGDRSAAWDLRRYRRRGPSRTTRILLDALRREGIGGSSLLDIGGGIGAIHHELLDDGVLQATHVDASSAYLEAARAEAARRKHDHRLRFLHGDFVDLAGTIEPADVVTLDRVLCCYPDLPVLVRHSASRCRRLYGVVYPRDDWWMRMAFPFPNLYFRLRRCPFRIFLHPVASVDEAIRGQGMRLVFQAATLLWLVAVYERSPR